LIKHTTYITVVAIVIVMFFLFHLAIFNIGWDRAWVTNVQQLPVQPADTMSMNIQGNQVDNQEIQKTLGEPRYFLIAPNENDSCLQNITKMLQLIKYSYAVYPSLDAIPAQVPADLIGLIVCEGNLDAIGDMEKLHAYVAAGKDAVFAKRLDPQALNYQQHYQHFGILQSGETYKQKGIDFLERLLISGPFLNADITTMANRITLDGTCLTLAVGYDKEIKEYGDRNPLIWRTHYDGGAMYFFNNDLLSDFTNAGALMGVLSMDKAAFVYPIINANMMILDGMPYFSTDQDQNLLQQYNRTSAQFQFDIMWVDLLGIIKGFDIQYTMYPRIGPGQQEMEQQILESMGKAVSINNFEIGYYPSQYFRDNFSEYNAVSALQYKSDKTTNQIVFDPRNFSYTEDGILNMPVISRVISRNSNEEQFKSFSMASALGYVAHYGDVVTVIEDQFAIDYWDNYKKSLVQGYYSVAQTYNYLDIGTATQTANKVGLFLDAAVDVQQNQDQITIKAQPEGERSYILRSDTREIAGYENCTVKQLSDEYYLVKVQEKDAIIHIKRSN